MRRREFLAKSLGTALVVVSGSAACSSGSSASGAGSGAGSTASVTGATAITEVFGDGQKLTAVALEYSKEIDTSTLSATTFSVEGRTVTKVYATTAPTPAATGTNGKYVIVEMSPDDADASLTSQETPDGEAPPSGSARPAPPSGQAGPPSGGGGGQTTKEATASVVQAETVTATDGTTSAPSATAISTTAVSNLIVDDFQQLEYTDPTTGETLQYNLFVPKDYDEGKSYPLVLFMHDSSVVSTEPTTTLTQGLGAICWASPTDQAERPAFVLAPQYSSVAVDDHDGYTVTPLVETTVNLVNEVTAKYHIDRNRLYTTGQSMGAIMSIVMDVEHPDLFAASYIVAGQWDPTTVGPMANDKLWIMVSEGDDNAYPGENAITAALEAAGAKVSRAVWDGTSSEAQFAADVEELAAKRTAINYVALENGTVVPSGETDNSLNNHMNTWRIAYGIEGIREWIFQQHK